MKKQIKRSVQAAPNNVLQVTFDPLPIFADPKTGIASNAPEHRRYASKEDLVMKSLIFLILSAFIFLSTGAFACSFDTDCDVGSQCVKSSGAIYGICAGGLFPGNENDDVPVEDSLDLDGTYGDTCSFDTDCGVSNKCYKESGSIYGVCVKDR